MTSFVDVGLPWGRGLFFGFGLTIGSAGLGRRIFNGGPPLGVRPGVRSAGEALMTRTSTDECLKSELLVDSAKDELMWGESKVVGVGRYEWACN